MWNKIYLERSLIDHPRAQAIIERLKLPVIEIESYDEVWGRYRKPYLHKRDTLNLFIARKKGQLVKEAPPAYGSGIEPHYYFIHAFNCVYECQYCYLQGHFSTPDIVLFLNHEEIIAEMRDILKIHPHERVWFHAGEFSDSLALSQLTQELEIYHKFCEQNPEAIIELRTKSVNIQEVLKLKPLANFITSFSLSPEDIARALDLKTPGTAARLKAMEQLHQRGHAIAAHLDPIVYHPDYQSQYQRLLDGMQASGVLCALNYISLGVVRFTKDVAREVERNYPDSPLLQGPMIKSFDQKIRYPRPLRLNILQTIRTLATERGVDPTKVYLCMEA